MELQIENAAIKRLLEKYRELWALGYALSLLSWDTNTYMPKGAARERGEIVSILKAMRQRLFLSNEFKSAFKEAEKQTNLNDVERGIIRVLRRDLEYYEKIPRELLEKEAKLTIEARVVWERAKQKSDFKSFEPYLEKIFEVQRKKAEYLGYEEHPYDALLDLYEEGLRTRDVEKLFSEVRNPLSNLFKRLCEKREPHHPLERENYEKKAMEALNKLVISIFGYPWDRGRLDVSAHPFTIDIGREDVRITTWYHGKDFRRSLGAVVHEFGHALYELQVDPALAGTPVGTGVSLGVHESQSRFWENVIWRSKAFVEAFLDPMRAFLPFLREYSSEQIYEYFALVRPEYIRVEADEVHYVLHIIVRFEIEKALLEGALEVSEVPQIWNEKMEKYIGIVPPNDRLGCLQDVHWSEGLIGYFPTYAIGSILAIQIKEAMEKDLGPIEDLVRKMRFEEIREWLRKKIHKWGAIYPPKELVKKVTGREISVQPFLEYLKEKYAV